MKKLIALLLACMMVFGLVACSGAETADTTAAAGGDTTPADTTPADTTPADTTPAEVVAEDITMTVWGPQAELGENNDGWLPQMCEAFDEAHPEWNITFEYVVCGEGDAGNKVTQDPTAVGDVYFYANDQLGTLLQANAIARLGGDVEAQVKADNSEFMVNSVSSEGALYGVPFTPNTWFMFYDKSVFSEEDVKSLETMLEKGKVSFPLTTGWYFGSFYAANGGTFFGDGTDASKGIDFSGEKGVAVTNYLVELIKNENFVIDADGAGMAGLRDGSVSAYFSGTWDTANVKEALGDNWAATVAPSYTINGEAKQLAPFGGSKAIGVNPNTAYPKAASLLAAYLGSKEAQLAHFEFNGTAPCHLALVAESEAVQADFAAVACANTVAQVAIIQPSIPEMGAYWGAAEAMAKAIVNGEVTAENAEAKTEEFNTSLNDSGL